MTRSLGADAGLLELHRNPSRGYRKPGRPDGAVARRAVPFLVFCDDLSFDALDAWYKSLKAVLEGGIEGRQDNGSSMPPRTGGT